MINMYEKIKFFSHRKIVRSAIKMIAQQPADKALPFVKKDALGPEIYFTSKQGNKKSK